jgi:hypothetical protein
VSSLHYMGRERRILGFGPKKLREATPRTAVYV